MAYLPRRTASWLLLYALHNSTVHAGEVPDNFVPQEPEKGICYPHPGVHPHPSDVLVKDTCLLAPFLLQHAYLGTSRLLSDQGARPRFIHLEFSTRSRRDLSVGSYGVIKNIMGVLSLTLICLSYTFFLRPILID